MVYQKDYLLRMIEMIGELVAAFFGHLQKGRFEKAEDLLERAYYDFLKEDAAFFRNIPANKLTTELLEQNNYTHGHLEILSELFYAEGELRISKGIMKDAYSYYVKAKVLLEFVLSESKTYSPEHNERMNQIKRRIQQLSSAAD